MKSRRIPSMPVPLACMACKTVFTLSKPEDIDGSFKELHAAGWLDYAAKGQGRERWTWKCPSCKPHVTGAALFGHANRANAGKA
jgi:hypothetical protein